MTWELSCHVCARSSWDGQPDDPDSDRCFACGQLSPACIACGQTRPERFGPNFSRALVVERGKLIERAFARHPWDSAGSSGEAVSGHRGAPQEGKTS